jgi:hypothetical protein
LKEGASVSTFKRVIALTISTLLSGCALNHADGARNPVLVVAQPDGSVTLKAGSVAAGVGYLWGHGLLTFGDEGHSFRISGLSLGDVGAANITASGKVYHLKKLADFGGSYVEVSAGATVAGGGSRAYLKNAQGVVIELEATTVGLRLNLSADRVKVTLASSVDAFVSGVATGKLAHAYQNRVGAMPYP